MAKSLMVPAASRRAIAARSRAARPDDARDEWLRDGRAPAHPAFGGRPPGLRRSQVLMGPPSRSTRTAGHRLARRFRPSSRPAATAWRPALAARMPTASWQRRPLRTVRLPFRERPADRRALLIS